MSDRLKVLPPDTLLEIIVVASPTAGYFDFVAGAIPKNGVVALIAGFRELIQAVCNPLKTF